MLKSGVDVCGDMERECRSAGSAPMNPTSETVQTPSGPIDTDLLRARSQLLAARLHQAGRDMEIQSTSNVPDAASNFMRINTSLPQTLPLDMPPRSALDPKISCNAAQAPILVAVPMQYNLPGSYNTAVPVQMPMHAAPPQMQAHMKSVAQRPCKEKKKSKRALREEVNALQELVQRISLVSSDVNTYAGSLIRQSDVLSQLEWISPGDMDRQQVDMSPQFALRQMPRRIDGGSDVNRRLLPQQGNEERTRRESEVSSASSNSTPAQKQATKQEGKSARKRRSRKSEEGAGENTTQSLKTELEAMRGYINTIVRNYIGAEYKLPADLRFSGDFSDLEAHAKRLANEGFGRIVEDEIRVNRKNNKQAFITMSTDREGLERDGIVMLPVARRYAFEGDTVRAFVLNVGAQSLPPAEDEEFSDETASQNSDADADNVVVISSDNCPKAFVIAIVKQTELRQIVGSISFTNPTQLSKAQLFYKFRPFDLRFPMVYIPEETCRKHIGSKQAAEVCGLLYLAHILETDCNGHCIAELVQPVGRIGNLPDELKAIMIHNSLSDIKPFEQRFNDMFVNTISPGSTEDLDQRWDLREKCIFTIDPLTARDLDDAVSIEQVGDNKYEVGVHISDVSHYLREDSELDNIVKERSTSIYLANEVIHMLPQPLCMRCSLLPGEDKLAFSVFWRMDRNGVQLNEKPKFTRTIIRSCTQFAYEHAQKIIDNPHERFTEHDFPTILNGFSANDVVKRVLCLHGIASSLRKARYEKGAISFNNPKLRFILDPVSGEPEDFEVEKQKEANRMIEEFMLLANQAVARFIHDSFPEISVLRNHPPPLMKSLKALREKFQTLGFHLDYSSSKALQQSIVRLCQEASNPLAMSFCLSRLLMKPMARANYFCSEGKTEPADLWHYALSIPIYTHFTSPIRRYPDIMVHRLLAASLNYCPPPCRTTAELHSLTKIANERKYNSKNAGEESCNLYFKRYVSNKQRVCMTAVVMEIYQHMMNVVTLESGHVISINYKMQKVLVDTQNAPNFLLVAERNVRQPPRKLQILSVVPIYLTIWDSKLTGFLHTENQLQPLDAPNNQLSVKKKQKSLHNQQQRPTNSGTANNLCPTTSNVVEPQSQAQVLHQQQNLAARMRQQLAHQQQHHPNPQQRIYSMRQNSL
ncbi:DIS3-like exonuclease 2 [Drosophila obscura]|uniref:DIS3-like exonuclease 2 n=1 Tax=Drosophila obscura TaxID=7282 RepID=UPI001BB17156|nr:DIS3-like exonuclease 2 [Drosophila obscura]